MATTTAALPKPQRTTPLQRWQQWLAAWVADPERRAEGQRATGLWGDCLELLRVVEAWPALGLSWDGQPLPAQPTTLHAAWRWFSPDLRDWAAEQLARETGCTYAVARRGLDQAVARGLVLPDGTLGPTGRGLLTFAAAMAARQLRRPRRDDG